MPPPHHMMPVMPQCSGFAAARAAAIMIMARVLKFLIMIVRIEGIEGTAKPLIGLLTLLGLLGATGVPLFTTWDSVAGSGGGPMPRAAVYSQLMQ